MSIISKLKVFKQTDPQNPNIYDIGANAENVTYTKDDINDVKSALNDLYSKVGNGGLSETIIAFFKNMNLEEKQLMPINGLSSFEKNDVCRLSGRLNVIYDDDQQDPPTPHATITINDRFEWSQSGVTREYTSGQNDIVYSLTLTSSGLSVDASNFSGHVQIHGLADDEQDNFKIYRSPADKVTKEDLQNQINALKAQIGFRGTIPSTGTGQQVQYLTDESYKNICYTNVKFRASSATSRELYIGGLLNILDSSTGRSQITENASQLLTGDGVQFKRSDRSSWQNLQDSRIEDDSSSIAANTKIQIHILLQSNIAVYGQIGNNNPTWHRLTQNNPILESDNYTIVFNQYHNFTFSITDNNNTIKNITRIGKPLFNADKSFTIPEDRSLVPYLEGEGEQQVSKTTPFIDLIYPIGSIYMSLNGTPPNYLFGGVWQKIEGRFLLAQGKYNDNQFFPYPVEEKKGAEQTLLVKHNHSLTKTSKAFSINSSTENRHRHSMGEVWSSGSGSKTAYDRVSKQGQTTKYTGYVDGHKHTVSITANKISDNLTITFKDLTKDNVNEIDTGVFANPGLGNNVGNLPPYLVVYMWTRVA